MKAFLCGCCFFSFAAAAPEQVLLALGKTQDSMSVSWVTRDKLAQEVQWHESAGLPSSYCTAAADTRSFTRDTGRIWYTHVAIMTNLKRNTGYEYRVGGTESYSQYFSFTNQRARPAGTPYKHVIFGDMGSSCAFTLCKACTATSEVWDQTRVKKTHPSDLSPMLLMQTCFCTSGILGTT